MNQGRESELSSVGESRWSRSHKDTWSESEGGHTLRNESTQLRLDMSLVKLDKALLRFRGDRRAEDGFQAMYLTKYSPTNQRTLLIFQVFFVLYTLFMLTSSIVDPTATKLDMPLILTELSTRLSAFTIGIVCYGLCRFSRTKPWVQLWATFSVLIIVALEATLALNQINYAAAIDPGQSQIRLTLPLFLLFTLNSNFFRLSFFWCITGNLAALTWFALLLFIKGVHVLPENRNELIDLNPVEAVLLVILMAFFACCFTFFAYKREFWIRIGFLTSSTLKMQEDASQDILSLMLPPYITAKLRSGVDFIYEHYPRVSVLFSHIGHFDEHAAALDPRSLIQWLNELFSHFDELTDQYDVYKVETIGDVYLICSGCPWPRDNHAETLAWVGLDMQRAMAAHQDLEGHDRKFGLRIGIHTGSVIAGVVGVKYPRYRLMGDTVNTASRMCTTQLDDGECQVSSETHKELTQGKDGHAGFLLLKRELEVKGKGTMLCYHMREAPVFSKPACVTASLNLTIWSKTPSSKRQSVSKISNLSSSNKLSGSMQKTVSESKRRASTNPRFENSMPKPTANREMPSQQAAKHNTLLGTNSAPASILESQADRERHAATSLLESKIRDTTLKMQKSTQKRSEGKRGRRSRTNGKSEHGSGAGLRGGSRSGKHDSKKYGVADVWINQQSASANLGEEAENEVFGEETSTSTNPAAEEEEFVTYDKIKEGLPNNMKIFSLPEVEELVFKPPRSGRCCWWCSPSHLRKYVRLEFQRFPAVEARFQKDWRQRFRGENRDNILRMFAIFTIIEALGIVLSHTQYMPVLKTAYALQHYIAFGTGFGAGATHFLLSCCAGSFFEKHKSRLSVFTLSTIGVSFAHIRIISETYNYPFSIGFLLCFISLIMSKCGLQYQHCSFTSFVVILYFFIGSYIRAKRLQGTVLWLIIPWVMYFYAMHQTERIIRKDFILTQKQKNETLRTTQFLASMLPEVVVAELKSGNLFIAHDRNNASVMFTDIVSFTSIAASQTPEDVVALLNLIFNQFDKLTTKHRVYKVETIGDAYLACAGVVFKQDTFTADLVSCALECQYVLRHLCAPDGKKIVMRIGIHTGPVIAGVVGRKMPRYHLFGSTVTLAEQFEAQGIPGKVVVSDQTVAAIHASSCQSRFNMQQLPDVLVVSNSIIVRNRWLVRIGLGGHHKMKISQTQRVSSIRGPMAMQAPSSSPHTPIADCIRHLKLRKSIDEGRASDERSPNLEPGSIMRMSSLPNGITQGPMAFTKSNKKPGVLRLLSMPTMPTFAARTLNSENDSPAVLPPIEKIKAFPPMDLTRSSFVVGSSPMPLKSALTSDLTPIVGLKHASPPNSVNAP